MSIEQARSVAATLGRVIDQFLMSPEQSLLDLDWFSQHDASKVLGWNSNELENVERCIDDMFEEQVEARSKAEAVCAWDGSLSYGELSTLACKLARHLTDRGIGPESLVPVCFDKSKFYIVACLAILKAGGAFVPLDSRFPLARLQSVAGKVGAKVLLCAPQHARMLEPVAETVIPVDQESLSSLPLAPEYRKSRSAPHNAAYMIFTSGTTGEPKGFILEHGALLSSARLHAPAMLMDSEIRALNFAASTFDLSITEIFVTLTLGGCVCVPSEDARLNDIEGAINSLGVNWALLAPTVAKFINPANVPGLRTLATAGEAMPQALVRSWSHRNLMNGYGPAETAVISHINPYMNEDKSTMCVGHQLGIRCWVVDRYNHDRLMPIGSVGELLIEGYTLARGYYKEEEKTSQAFIYDPAWTRHQPADPERSRRRMYKSGDLVRFNTDGTLHIAGRKDNQVKFHGQRIELGEIEHHINLDRRVKYGMVFLPKAGPRKGRLLTMLQLADDEDQDLVRNGTAFKLLDDELKPVSDRCTTDLRKVLSKRLPPYMIPSVWLVVEYIPRLPSGKLDRKKTIKWIEEMSEETSRCLNTSSKVDAGSLEPANETETELKEAWAHVLNLNLDQVGLEQPFLSMGGDSISAMQVMGRCRKKGIGLTVHEILRSKSIRQLAQLAKAIQTPSQFEESIDQPFDLSPIQCFYFDRPGHANGHFNQSFLLRANLKIRESDLRAVLDNIVQRHSMLRARFSRNESTGIWQQRVTNEISPSYRLRNVQVDARDLVDSKLAESQTCLSELTGPLLAADLIDVGCQEQLLFVVAHHLVIDLVSWRIILQEIEELLLDPKASLEKPLPFQTWCRLQEERTKSSSPAQVLPIEDVPSGNAAFWEMEHQQHTYGDMINEEFQVDASLTPLLLSKCHEAFHTEIPDVLIAALIYSFSQTFQDRSAPPIFAEGHGREPWDPAIDLSRTVGWFTTIYPVFVSPARQNEALADIVRYVKDGRRRIPGKGRPYFASRWLTAGGQQAFGHHWPLEVTFNYLGQYQQLERKGALLTPAAAIAGETRGAGGAADVGHGAPCLSYFEISAVILQGTLRFSFTFNRNMSHQRRIREWISNCQDAVGNAVKELCQRAPESTLSDFPLLPLSYEGFETLKAEKLPKVGVMSLDLVEDAYPCSPMQEGLLVSTLKDSNFYASHTLHEVKLNGDGEVDADRLAQAWKLIVDRHPLLRTIFVESVSQRNSLYDQVVLKRVDAHAVMSAKSTDAEAIAYLNDQPVADYTDRSRPLHRFVVCKTSSGKVFCRLEISHVIMDGTSLSILFRDLALAYGGKVGMHGPLYSDYIKFLLEQPVQPAIDYWKSYLANIEPCHFPVLNDGSASSKELKCVRIRFDRLRQLQKHCDENGLTFANAIHAAWALTLRCYTDSEEVCFGYLTSARDAPLEGAQDGVGPYINMLVCRVMMEDLSTVKQVMSSIQQDYFDSLPHRHTPLAEVQHALQLSNVSLFNTALSYRKLPPAASQEPLISFAEVVPTYDPDEYNVSINIEAGEDEMAIDLTYWTDCLSNHQATNVASTFVQTLDNILDHCECPIGRLENLSGQNYQQIREWNEKLPEVVDDCIHRVFQGQVATRPSAPAICGWDANYTYYELDAISSKLANHLAACGVGPESFVLVCFEKSAYTIIAMLAVLKAGGACVPLDAKFPRSAIELRAQDTGSQVILAASQCADTVKDLVPQVLLVDEDFLRQLPDVTGAPETSVGPRDACFVIYTSGSTGKPKGVVLEHRNITSSARAHGPLLGFTADSRVLQFASYTFDNSLEEMFTTLMSGGCVCVPSEHDRLNDLAGAINSLNVNLMDITPTVATFLQPSQVPTVKDLTLGAEAITKRAVDIWKESVTLHGGYGPSECSINCAYTSTVATPGKTNNIGKACGCVLWVVDAADYNRLVPIGCTGELLVEGPTVARGYLNDPEKTANAFIVNPSWAQRSSDETRRMYKTGDLVRYDSDGSLVYLGRKDTQVKLNGQRIELGEIEHHVERNLPSDSHSAVELVVLGEGQTSKKELGAFICLARDGAVPDAHTNNVLLPISETFKKVAKSLEVALSGAVPAYMVPSAWIPVIQMPLTLSGKLNRRQLRSLAQSIPDERVSTYRLAGKSGRAPSTEKEKQLASLWEDILRLEKNAVGAEDSFFKLGGDSIGAMRLVTAARALGLSLTVANVFQKSKLCEMASSVSEAPSVIAQSQVAPFAMVQELAPIEKLKSELESLCQIDIESIEDIYPCTTIQEGLMALSIKEPGAYVAQLVYRLTPDVDITKFKAAWERVTEVENTLRTRIVFTEQFGFLQVVVRKQIEWNSVGELGRLPADLRQLPPHDGGELARYTIVGDGTASPYFVLTIHHALYDGWCLPLILDKVKAAYHCASLGDIPSGPRYSNFIHHLAQINKEQSDGFWRENLAGVTSVQFPRLPHPGYQAHATAMLSYETDVVRKEGSEVTTASLIRAAWASTLAAYSGSDDVVFCETVTGRDAPVDGIEDMIGATLTTTPTRISVKRDQKIANFLLDIQSQSAAAMPYQFAGLQNIKRLDSDTAAACDSQNLIAINRGSKASSEDTFWDAQNNDMAGTNFYTYPLMLSCYSGEGTFEVDAHYDEKVVSSWQMERLLKQFGFVLTTLASGEQIEEPIGQMNLLNHEDQACILQWNSSPLLPENKCIHNVITDQSLDFPQQKAAVCAWDASFTYRELDSRACLLAANLIDLGVQPGSVVPLCFEKSAYTVVAMLAVLKAGAAFVPLQADHPEARLRDIVKDVEGGIALCSPRYESLCAKIAPKAIPLDGTTLETMSMIDGPLPHCDANAPAYIIFTSGTTGKPKGTVIEHAAFCTGARAHGAAMQMGHDSRVLQFASHTFDASVMEILTTLICGGCVCIPNDESRLNDCARVINEMEVNWTLLTPSFVQTIQPEQVPTLRTLVMGGEAMSQTQISTWGGKLNFMNAYGPSETSVVATVNSQVTAEAGPTNIGRAVGSRCWIADPTDHNYLMPVGSVGELLVEGPILARGYLNNHQKTAEAFIQCPKWAATFDSDVGQRLYKTGDLVKYAADGSLIYQGRKDTQAKLHGQRLELGEVEHHLNTDDGIKHALAAIPGSGPCKKRLVAVLSLQALSASKTSVQELEIIGSDASSLHLTTVRERMSNLVPPYMVPSSWIVLKELPLQPSGKLDRRRILTFVEGMSDDAFKQISEVEAASENLDRDATSLELQLQGVWAHVLNKPAEKISFTQSFLQLGGDSISAMQVMARCRSEELGVTVSDIIQSKNIPQLAARVTLPKTMSYTAEEMEKNFDLSPIQQMYFETMGDNWTQFNQSVLFQLKHQTSIDLLQSAVHAVVGSHSMLRARFSQIGPNQWQQHISRDISGSCKARHHTDPGALGQAQALIEESQRSLDILQGPVMTMDVFESTVADHHQLLCLTAHHLVVDVVSWRVIVQDVEDYLASGSLKAHTSLPFQTWCQLQAEHTLHEVPERVLRNERIPAADFAYWNMSDQSNLHGDAVSSTFELDERTTSNLISASHEALHTDPADVLMATLLTSFAKIFPDRESIPAVYNEGHGREPWDSLIDLSRTVGWFTTMCPIYLPNEARSDSDVTHAIRWVKDFRRCIPDKGRPYFAYRHLTADGKSRFSEHWPMEITFNYLGQISQLERNDALLIPVDALSGDSINAQSDIALSTSRFSLFEVSAFVTNGSFKISISYNKYMKRQLEIRKWLAEYEAMLNEAVAQLMQMKPERTLSDYPLLPLTYNGLGKLSVHLPELGVSSMDDLEDVYPCSLMQQGLLISQSRNAENYSYHALFEVKSKNKCQNVNPARLSNAWQAVIDRHSSLRTVFLGGIGQADSIYQVVLKHFATTTPLFESIDSQVSDCLNKQPAVDYAQLRPPHRLSICKAASGRVFCKLEMSHAISDGTSMPIILGDLSQAYEFTTLRRGPLFSDYLAHLQWKRTVADVDYWKSYLADIEPCHFPTLTDGKESARQLKCLDVEAPVTNGVQAFCKQHGVTLSNVLQLAWALVLKCYTGSSDVCFGYLASGRDAPVPDIQQAVGVFINMLTCRINLAENVKLHDALQKVQADFANGMAHQACSLAEVQHELKISGSSLFNTAFTFQRRSDSADLAQDALQYEYLEACDPSEYHLTVNVETSDSHMLLGFTYWSSGFSDAQIRGVANVFQHVVNEITRKSDPELSVGGIDFFSEHSLQRVRNWNSRLPTKVNKCIHEIVEEHARGKQMEATAVHGWDGNLSYAELDSISTRLATHLSSIGVGLEDCIPLCFEKSIYTIVAMLAVMKAGATFVPVDYTQPDDRLKYLFEITRAKVTLCSPLSVKRISSVTDFIFVVSRDSLASLPEQQISSVSAVPAPDTAAYIIFTSGTTGLPKGTIIEHAAFCTGAVDHARAMGMRSDSRVLQFASYTFDASVMEILSTLIAGGCVCVPSDQERMNDIPGLIERMSVTWTLLTPSVASILEPATVPSLKVLVTGGEAMSTGHIKKWKDAGISLINAYGPSECSVIATIGVKIDEKGREINADPANIGHAIGGRNWVVNPNNHDQLIPLGGIGELVVEGSTAARGYLNNDEKTKAAFITDPAWTRSDAMKGIFTQKECMYKTGDLVRANTDGSYTYIARKDTQIKLNGQRIEVGEIEHHVKRSLPASSQSAVDLVAPAGGSKALAVFFSVPDNDGGSVSAVDEILLPMSERESATIKDLESALGNALPAHMVPTLYVPVTKMPWTASGKLDRSRLRNIAQVLSMEDVIAYKPGEDGTKRAASSSMEKKMQDLWEQILGLPAGSVGANDNFFRIGGDSVSAMKLVSLAHTEGVSVTVLNIFRSPKLSDLAMTCARLKNSASTTLERFSLLKQDGSLEQTLDELANQCRIDRSCIQDAYPCSSLQEGLLTLSMKQPGAYVLKNVFRLPRNADVSRVQEAWQRTVDEIDILRTRIVHTKSSAFLQVVLARETIAWNMLGSLEEAEEESLEIPAFNGSSLSRYTIVDGIKSDNRYLVWSIHHAIYDGWSMPMMLKRFEANYRATGSGTPQVSYSRFIEYLCDTDAMASDEFWRTRLSETSAIRFPVINHSTSESNRQGKKLTHIARVSRDLANTGVTLPTLIRAAWAIVVATYTSCNDVAFGETLAGRDIPVPGITNVLGPTLTTIPQRVLIDQKLPLLQFLHYVHQLSAEAIPYQHAGLQHIRRLSSDTEVACDFQNLLVIQTAEEEGHVDLLQPQDGGVGDSFFTYPLVLECTANSARIDIEAHHDPRAMSDWQVKRLLYQFDHVMKQLCGAHGRLEQKVGEISVFSPQDMQVVREWNYNPPITIDDCIHSLFSKLVSRQPDSPAVCSWDMNLTYKDLSRRATKLAGRLSKLKVGRGSHVPVVLDKSGWSVVSILGILLAGGAFIPLDSAHPVSRHVEIIQDVQAHVLITPPQYLDRYKDHVSTVVTIDEASMSSMYSSSSSRSTPSVDSKDAAYVIFTSGSTGKPKGVVVEHGAFCSSSNAYRRAMLMQPDSRVLQFASLTFDVGVMEVLTTLTYGGCVCIPSDEARIKDLEGSIRDMNVSWAFLTPSIANIMDPSRIPCLEVLSCGGEALSEETVLKWADSVTLVNGYGPTEAAVIAVVNPHVSRDRNPTVIGRGHDGGYTWIVEPDNHDRLAPVGGVGELCLEGPLLAREYINDEAKTNAAFVKNTSWMNLLETGDEERKMYKTGDLVRYNEDGSIVFIGRKDNQVKLNGQRLELGEIEHRLEVYPQIKHAFVALPKSGFCRKRLVAVVSVTDLPGAPAALAANTCHLMAEGQRLNIARTKVAEATSQLADQVPEYMVPSIWVILESLPILVSGKLDRKQVGSWLGKLDESTYRTIMSATKGKEPSGKRTASAKILRDIFANVFDVASDAIKFDESFISLGGDSISAMRVMALGRNQGFNLSLQDILRSKSITQLASLAGPSSLLEVFDDEAVEEPFDLSPVQRLFFQSIGGEKGDFQFNQSYFLEIKRKVAVEEVQGAFKAIVGRHSMLRARFTKGEDEKWQQCITQDVASSYRFTAHDVADQESMVPIIAKSQGSMNIEEGPLLMSNLFNLREGGQGLFIAIHHLVVDAVSWLIILQDLEEHLSKKTISTDTPFSFQVWNNMQIHNAEKEGSKEVERFLPINFAPAQMEYWGIAPQDDVYGDLQSMSFELDQTISALAQGDCHKSLNTDPVDVLTSAIAQSFSRTFTDRTAATIFIEGHGREPWDSSINLSQTVGWFTSMYPLYVDNKADDDSLDVVKRVKDARRRVPSNGRPYFASRFLTLQGQSAFDEHAPIEILFNYFGRMGSVGSDDSLFQRMPFLEDDDTMRLTSDVGANTQRMAAFEISAAITDGKIRFTFMFNKNVNRIDSVKQWINECQATLEETICRLARVPRQPTLSDFPMLPMTYEDLDAFSSKTLTKAHVRNFDDVEDVYPCSPMQEGLLLSQYRDPESYIFHTVSEVRSLWDDSPIDAQKLVQAWQLVVDRHAALRTVFVDSPYEGGVFDQVVLRRAESGALRVNCSDSEVMDTLASITMREDDDKKCPKLPHKLTVCESMTGKIFVKLQINHAVVDGASQGNIMRDLALAYEDRLPSGPGPLYSDYIAYVKKQGRSAGVNFWKSYLTGAQPTFFPSLNTATSQRRLGSTKMRFGRFAELQELSRKFNVTLSNVLHAVWAMVLRCYVLSDDISFGYLTAGRDAPVKDIQDTVGIFINMLIFRIQFKPDMTLDEVFRKVQSEYLDSLPHQHTSLARVQHELKIAGLKIAGGSLFNTAVSIQGSSANKEIGQSGIEFDTLVGHDPSEYAVTVNMDVTPGSEMVIFRYWTDVLSDDQAVEVAERMGDMLQSIIEKPSQKISDLFERAQHTQAPVPEVSGGASIEDLRPLVNDLAQEIIQQMFKMGSLVQYAPNAPASVPNIKLSKDARRRNTVTSVTNAENEQVLKTLAAEITAARPTKELVRANEIVQGVKDFKPIAVADQLEEKANHIVQEIRELRPLLATDRVEAKLRALWSRALELKEDMIDSDDNFFELGGDSLVAMEMAAAARKAGVALKVVDIFHNPTFARLVKVARRGQSPAPSSTDVESSNASREVITYAVHDENYEPFSLLEVNNTSSFLQQYICPYVNVFAGGIADVLPVTDFQSLSITASLLESRWMLKWIYLDGRGEVDIKRLRQCISKVIQNYDILRTVFIPHGDHFLQVVLRQMEPDFTVTETEAGLEDVVHQLHEHDIDHPPVIGQSPLRFVVAKLKGTDRHRIHIRISHAQYDGVSFPKILEALQLAHGGAPLVSPPSFSRFINHAVGRNTDAQYDYWKGVLQGSSMTQIVRRHKPNYNRAGGDSIILKQDVALPSLATHGITEATIVKAAWAMVLAELTAQADVVFGTSVNGRSASVPGIEQIVGPCINLMPLRVSFQAYWSVLDLLRNIQNQHLTGMAFETLGFREIIKHCTQWSNWSHFSTFVSHNHNNNNSDDIAGLKIGNTEYAIGGLSSNEDFADINIVSTTKAHGLIEVALIYTSDGQIPAEFAKKAHAMLCDAVTSFAENPYLTLLNPKKLTGMPCQTLEEQHVSEDASVLHATDNLSDSKLRLLFDIVEPCWQEVLPIKADGQCPSLNVESDFFELGGDMTGLALISVRLQAQGFAVSIEDLIDNATIRDQMGLISLQHFKHLDNTDRQSISGSDTSTLADIDDLRPRQSLLRLGSKPGAENMWRKSMSFMGKLMKRNSMAKMDSPVKSNNNRLATSGTVQAA